jgi:predicted phosphodiesterase
MSAINRRQFLSTAAIAAGASLLPATAQSEPASTPGSFDFLFLTDTHIQPELAAADGCALAFKKAASIPADFAIQGGDHVFDALAVDRKRADSLFDLYDHTQQSLGLKVHHAIGNHDHFGVFAKTGIETTTPGFGKKMFEDRVGPTHQSFDHKGYHFVILDSIHLTDDRSWEARIDDPQLAWLSADLEKLPTGTPLIVVTHVPFITAASQYAAPTAAGGSGTTPVSSHPQLSVVNAWQVLPLLEKHNTLAVLQGHTHINEVIRFRGIPYVTSGAICGNWWHGTRWGIPEGFTVVSLRNGIIDWRYETYGFKSIAPQNT